MFVSAKSMSSYRQGQADDEMGILSLHFPQWISSLFVFKLRATETIWNSLKQDNEIYWKDVGQLTEFPRGLEKHTQKINRNHRTLVSLKNSENHATVPLWRPWQPPLLALDTECGHWYHDLGFPQDEDLVILVPTQMNSLHSLILQVTNLQFKPRYWHLICQAHLPTPIAKNENKFKYQGYLTWVVGKRAFYKKG